jgi:hypothetical protein
MLMSPAGLRPEKDCAGEDQQQMNTTDPTFRQRGHTRQQPRNCLKYLKKEKIWSRVRGGRLASRQTGRLTVGRNVTLTLTLTFK